MINKIIIVLQIILITLLLSVIYFSLRSIIKNQEIMISTMQQPIIIDTYEN